MTYFFETYGCQMNKAESASIEQIFIDRLWTEAPDAESADFIVINTCSVRATAESRIHGRLGWYTSLRKERKESGKKPFTLAVTGCMAERLKDDLKKQFRVVDYVVGTFQKQHFNDIISAVEQHRRLEKIDNENVYSFAPLSYEKGAFQAFVPIMHGCNNFCSYCIVPYVRGREISRNPDEIIAEIDKLSASGVREITLLGQNVNSYKWENLDFPALMQLIANRLRETSSSIGWVRFMSSHPKDISEKLIDVIAKERVLCRHIHLPVQSGSTNVLTAMNRKYSREDYLSKVEMIRAKLPDASLSTDILLGFPGETDSDFDETVSLLQKVGYEAAYMYYYNPREGTKACEMDNQIPMEVKKGRLARVIDIQLEINRREMAKRVGNIVPVLVETVSRDNPEELLGRTEQDEHVVFIADSSLIGTFAQVELSELTGNTFRGKVIK